MGLGFCVLFLELFLASPKSLPGHQAMHQKDHHFLISSGLTLYGSARQNIPQTILSVDSETYMWQSDQLLKTESFRAYPAALLTLIAEYEFLDRLSFRGWIDSGFLQTGQSLEPPLEESLVSDGEAIDEHFRSGAFVRESVVQLRFDPLLFELGRRYTQLGQGLIYEDFGTGGFAQFSWSDFEFETAVFLVGREFSDYNNSSPIFSLSLQKSFSFFDYINIYGVFFWDRSQRLSDIIKSALAESIIARATPTNTQLFLDQILLVEYESQGYLNYIGSDGFVLLFNGISINYALALSWGKLILSGANQNFSFYLKGLASSLELNYSFSPRFGLGLAGMLLTGDQPPDFNTNTTEYTYNSYIGVAPFWRFTGLFFSGGINQTIYPGRAASAGINGHGVVGVGPRAEFITETVSAEMRLCWLQALSSTFLYSDAGSGRHYGVELDTLVDWSIWDWLKFSMEFDLIYLGNYFEMNDFAYQLIGQMHVAFDYY